MLLEVVLPTPLRRTFDYTLPDASVHTAIVPGIRVKVPFGRQTLIGIIVGKKQLSSVPTTQLKCIFEILDRDSLFSPVLFNLLRWSSDYYHHSLGEVLHTALPVLLRRGKPAQLPQRVYWQVSLTALDLTPSKRSPRQTALLTLLKQQPQGISDSELKAQGFSQALIKKLLVQGWLTTTTIDTPMEITYPCGSATSALDLNSAQRHALDDIIAALATFRVFLLNGITGSGKTEVYLQVLSRVFAQGKQALVLVPEIVLTPQTLARFQSRFCLPIAVYHSHLTPSERLQSWLHTKSGHAKLVIATRSGVFLPFKNLGLIIVDEEHDLSFKQQEGFRYSARDVAVRRAHLEYIPILLGTATPSLESFYNIKSSRYQLLTLPHRAGGAGLPTMQLIDMRQQPLTAGMTPALMTAIKQTLAANNQVLLFLNRRGYAPIYLCHACGWIATCTRCDAHMTLHRHTGRLRCHHCDYSRSIMPSCPQCSSTELITAGVGTQQLENKLQSLVPEAKIVRIDRDSTQRKGELDQHLANIHTGDKQILIGTQMLAKGHHFPNVTLVGILNADNGLFSADFRALERTAQLLIQVAGRAGRADKLGRVLIQTHHPQHRLLQELIHQGYSVFAQTLLKDRQHAQLPPFSHLALLRGESSKLELVQQFLSAIRDQATALNIDQVDILGPVSALMEKRAGRYRMHLLFRSCQRRTLQRLLSLLCAAIENSQTARTVRWSIDIDPQEMD